MGGPGGGRPPSDVAKPVRTRVNHTWDAAELNKLAKAKRLQVKDQGGGRVNWQKVLDDYFEPTYKEGERKFTPQDLSHVYRRFGGDNYRITWEYEHKPRRNQWMAPIPTYTTYNVRMPKRAFMDPPMTEEGCRRQAAEAERRAQPRQTSYLGTPVKEKKQGCVTFSAIPRGMPRVGSEAWRQKVEANDGAIKGLAKGLLAHLRREVEKDEALDRARAAWNLPPM